MTFHRLGFDANYECQVLPGLPGEGSLPIQFHRAEQRTHSEGLVIKVTLDNGTSWIGNFQRGDEGISEVYAHPVKESVCVVAAGQGYIVPVHQPTKYQIVKAYPIKEVFPIPGKSLMIFVDLTELIAYGPEGVAWKTERLSWDGLKIVCVTPELIQGKAWDSPLDREVEFYIDVHTGRHRGGSSPNKVDSKR